MIMYASSFFIPFLLLKRIVSFSSSAISLSDFNGDLAVKHWCIPLYVNDDGGSILTSSFRLNLKRVSDICKI